MPVIELKPWDTGTEVELCGSAFCFQLYDKGDKVEAFYEEFGDRGGMLLNLSLQKKEGYKEYVKRFIKLDIPEFQLNELSDFYETYKFAVDLYKLKKKVSINLNWEHENIAVTFNVMMLRRTADVWVKLINGPNQLQFDMDVSGKRIEEEAEKLVKYAAGLYILFKEYVKSRESS